MRDEFAPEEFLLDGEEGFGMTDEDEELAEGEDTEDGESDDLEDEDEE